MENPNKNSIVVILVVFLAFLALGFAGQVVALAAGPAAVNLGSAGDFVILSESGISTTGSTLITGVTFSGVGGGGGGDGDVGGGDGGGLGGVLIATGGGESARKGGGREGGSGRAGDDKVGLGGGGVGGTGATVTMTGGCGSGATATGGGGGGVTATGGCGGGAAAATPTGDWCEGGAVAAGLPASLKLRAQQVTHQRTSAYRDIKTVKTVSSHCVPPPFFPLFFPVNPNSSFGVRSDTFHGLATGPGAKTPNTCFDGW